MSRIALDLRFWRRQHAGLSRYSQNLLSELIQLNSNHEFTAIINEHEQDEFHLTAPNLKKSVVTVPHYSYAEQTQFLKFLNQQKFDLVHFTHFNHPVLYRGRFVVTVHDMIMHFFPGQFQQGSLLHKLAYQWVISDCKRAEKIIVPSQATANDLVQHLKFNPQKIVITPEGSEAKFQPASTQAISEVKKKLNLPDRYVLFVSRWERYKGLPVLIEAYEKSRQQFPGLGLVITGKPDKQNQEIVELVRSAQQKNPAIITPGFVDDDDLPALYSGASVYVHPSWYEGFGIMILEAFSAGVPVITSNTSSLPEVTGDAGILIDPTKPEEITTAINQVLENPSLAEQMRQKGFDRVKQFSWNKMAEQTLSAYNEALRNV